MRGPARLAVTLLAAVTVAACATMTVGTYRATSFTPAPYQTWSWAAPDALPAGDARLDGNGVFRDHLEGAVEKQLGRRGLTHVFTGAPDLWIHYHTNVVQRFDVETLQRERASCSEGECGRHVIQYDEGTIVIDIVDARTNALVWRGWARDSVTGILDDQGRMADYVDAAMRKIMERFPGM